MILSWFKNKDNVSYSNIDDFAEHFAKKFGIYNLREEIEEFRKNPIKEGKIIRGNKRTSIKLLIPNDYFDADIIMGDTVWVYLGEHYQAHCIYWN